MNGHEFEGRTVLVTGAAHGFGRAISRAFSEQGARVFACDVQADGLEDTRGVLGSNSHTQLVDVTDREAVRGWVRHAVGETGRVDVLVNNAGGVLGQVGRPIEEVEPDAWDGIVAVNQTAAFWTAQAAAPHMKRERSGRIVNISSGAGLGVSKTGIQAYASAKAGLIGLTRQLAHELGPFGITVNCIAPGFVLSNPTTVRQWEAYGTEGQERLVDGIALRRLGTVEDIAEAVLFLGSDRARWISGVTLPVDGGK
jgi:3-oxoacyl-[acyl-carrier protein] reductase